MTQNDANALVKAFLAAKAAGQEELWRETHPAAPDGPTVLILWLMASRRAINYVNFRSALKCIDARCGQRIAIYAAIVAHPIWNKYSSELAEIHRCAPAEAIRAAIACYRDPTDDNRRAAEAAGQAAARATTAVAAGRVRVPHDVSTRATYAGDAAYVAAIHAAGVVRSCADAAYAVWDAAYAYSSNHNSEKVVDAAIAAIADHYEGRPLEMP